MLSPAYRLPALPRDGQELSESAENSLARLRAYWSRNSEIGGAGFFVRRSAGSLIRSQTTVPKNFPMPAVRAIANALQKVSRAVARRIFAPPGFASSAPRRARKPQRRSANDRHKRTGRRYDNHEQELRGAGYEHIAFARFSAGTGRRDYPTCGRSRRNVQGGSSLRCANSFCPSVSR